jgi:hypothetical protein
MFKLDNNFLSSLGLGSLPVDEKNKLLQAIYERLEMNVGMRLAERMTDSQLDEFESFIDNNDEAGALRWLETNFPDYKQVVAEELEKLKKEISQAAPQILAAAQQPNPNDSLTKESPQSIDLAQEQLRQSIDANPDNKYAGLQDTEQSAGFNPGQPITPQQEGPAQAWPTEQPPAGPGI